MGKVYPQLVVTPANMKSNMEKIVALAAEGGMEVNGVAKGFCCIPECCRAMMDAGCKSIGGARTGDLRKRACISTAWAPTSAATVPSARPGRS